MLLLLPSSTYRAGDFLDAARRVGAEVVVASETRQTLADEMGDGAVVIPCDDPVEGTAAVVALNERTPLDAIVAVDDGGVVVAAAAGARLGLRHADPVAVAATRDKALARAALGSAGVPQPVWAAVGPDHDAGAVAETIGLPCVVKPRPLSASRGVIRVDTADEARVAAARVRSILADAGEDANGAILVEQFVPGVEVAVEAIVQDGVLAVLAVFDKPDPLNGPYFEETIYVTPSRLPPATLDTIARITADATAALGLTQGPVHAELRVDGERVVVLELAARTIGGLCARTLRFGLGVSLEELVLRAALGRPLGSLARLDHASGVMMLPIPRAGVLTGIHGADAARAVPGIVGLELTVTLGRRVVPLPEGDRYLGFLFARAETPAEVEQALRDAHGRLDVAIADA